MSQDRYLVVTASMGAGHDHVAAELARRFAAAGAETEVVDLLAVLPGPVGLGLRHGYAGMLRVAPWLYEAIYRIFFVPREHVRPSTSPLVRLGVRGLRPVVERFQPTAVVSTFHIAGQVAGAMRRRGELRAPSVVVVTEVVAHALWLDPGTDLFCCLFPEVADAARRGSGRPAIAPGPIVDPQFLGPVDAGRVTTGRARLGLTDGEDAVLISTGSWGVGAAAEIARELATMPRLRPVVLCGANEALRRRVAGVPGAVALGWRQDVADLLAGASVVIDNAGGSMCLEAFAAGVPVVEHRPLPGHGGPVVRALAAADLVTYAEDTAALRQAVDVLRTPGGRRDKQVDAARAIFVEDPAVAIADALHTGVSGTSGL